MNPQNMFFPLAGGRLDTTKPHSLYRRRGRGSWIFFQSLSAHGQRWPP